MVLTLSLRDPMLYGMGQDVFVGYVDENGMIKLQESAHLTPGQKVLVALTSTSISETALLSEPALARDWNRPEEDEAWSHLQQE